MNVSIHEEEILMDNLKVIFQVMIGGCFFIAFIFIAAIAGCSSSGSESFEKVLQKAPLVQGYDTSHVVPR